MTEESRKIQIPVEVDATGAAKGFDQIKQGAQSMAQGVAQAGQVAAKGVDGIGAGADGSAKKLDSATRSIIGSIQRTTAVMEAGERGSVKYYEALAGQRGVPTDALRPYLAQLDAAAAKQTQATAALKASGTQFNEYGLSVRQTSAALRQVPAQFTDIITSLQGGQAPLTVLLQQGGQLKDVFGGIVPAAKALGGFLLGLVNPFTVAAAAIGGLAFALNGGSKELRDFQDAATISGNALGANVSQFNSLRDSLEGIAGTKGKAAEALTEIAGNGKLAGDSVKSIAEAAILMEKATGQAVAKTVDQFVKLAEAPLTASLELNKQYNFLTAAVYSQIKALEDQGRATQAAELAEKTFAETLKARATSVIQNAGLMERAWKSLTGAAKGAWDAMLNVGREDSLAQRLSKAAGDVARVQAQLDGTGTFGSTGGGAATGGASATRRAALEQDLAAAKQREAFAQESVRLEKRGSEAAVEANRVRQRSLDATVAFDKLKEQSLTKQQKLVKEIAQAERDGLDAGKSRAEIEKVIAGIRERNKEGGSGAAGTGQSEVAAVRAKAITEAANIARLRAQIADPDRAESLMKQTDAEKQVLKIQEELKTSISGVARAQKEKALAATEGLAVLERESAGLDKQVKSLLAARDAYDKLIESTGKAADGILQQALGQEAANATLGKGKTAIEELTLAQIKNNVAEAEASDRFAPAYVAAINAKAEAQERFVKALQQSEFKQAELKLNEAGRTAADETQLLQLELSLVGQTREVREKILGQRRAELKLAKELADIDKLNLGAGTDADLRREELRAQARANSIVEANNTAAKAVAEEWQRTAESINTSITDALLRGFESGKGFAANLRDTVVNMFKTLVLRPVINAVVNTGSQTVSSALGLGGQGQGSGIGGLAQNASSLNSLYGIGSQALTGASVGASTASLGFANGVGALGGDALGALIGANGGYAGVAATGGVSATAGGAAATAGAAGAGATLAAAVPYVAAALAVYSLLSDDGGGPKTESGGGFSIGRETIDGPTLGFARSLESSFAEIAKQLGVSSRLSVGAFSSADPQGDSLTQLAVVAGIDGQAVYNRGDRFGGQVENVGRSDAELQAALGEEASRVLIAALKSSDLEQDYKDFLNTVSDSATSTVLEAAVGRIVAVKGFQDALEKLPFENLKNLSFAAADGLIAAAGGLEALTSNLATYYQNFYTAEEQRAQVIRNLFSTLGASGVDATSLYDPTIAGFRALVDAQDLSTASGQKAYAALIGVSGAFAQLANTGTAATEALKQAVAAEAEAQKQAAAAVIETRKLSISGLKALSDSLKSALESLSGGLSLTTARAQIAAALATAQSGGGLPTAEALSPALRAVTQADTSTFASALDFKRFQTGAQNDITELAKLTDAQLSIEQKMLDALLVIKTATLSVAEALGLVNAEKAATAAQAAQAAAAGLSDTQAKQAIAAAQATAAAAQAAQAAAAAAEAARLAALRPVFDFGGISAEGGGSFAIGTNFVPNDMKAQIHKGERIIPAADNRELIARLSAPATGSAELVAEVRALSQLVAQQQSALDAINKNSRTTADTLQNVTRGGNAMVTEAA